VASESALDRHIVTLNITHFAGLIAGDHASGRIDVAVRPADGPTLVCMDDQEIEIPAGWPLLDRLLAAAMTGAVTYLARDGRRVAAVLPADLAESIVNEPLPGDGDDHPVSAAGPRPTLDDLQREQGIRPVEDPAELRGEEMADFDQFFSAAMSARAGEQPPPPRS
jgi:hypothetical protein